MKKKLSDRCWHRVLCPHCDGVGKAEYAHWVDDLEVDGGQREAIEALKCHICNGEGTLIGIPAAVAEAADAVVEAAENVGKAFHGYGNGDTVNASHDDALTEMLDKLEALDEVRDD